MTPLEILYYIGYTIRKRQAIKNQKRLPYKVISVGNITVGGTGKTPATIALAEEARKRGFSPIILTRGYRGKAKGPCFVDVPGDMRRASSVVKVKVPLRKRDCLFHASRFYGDEPVLMAERLKDVPIVKCADRYKGGLFALQSLQSSAFNLQPFLFILDDGFQHWRLYRDVDIVLIDGLNPFGNRKMLPIGQMREPLNELKRADIFIVTKTENKALSEELKGINPEAPVYFAEYRINRVRDADSNEYPVEMLKDKRVYAFCGIANPDSFRQMVLSISADMAGFKAYRDHHKYKKADVLYLKKQCKILNCDLLITTEKDMVKLRELGSGAAGRGSREALKNILGIEIGFHLDKEVFDTIFNYLAPQNINSSIIF